MKKVLLDYTLTIEEVAFEMKETSMIAGGIWMAFKVARGLAKARLNLVAK